MRHVHSITLTRQDLRAALHKFLDNGEPGGPFPENAHIRCLTQSTFKGTADNDRNERDAVVIEWGTTVDELEKVNRQPPSP